MTNFQGEWKRPSMQGQQCSIHNYCKPGVVMDIIRRQLTRVGGNAEEIFKRSCFGHYWDLSDEWNANAHLHSLMTCEIIHRGDDLTARYFQVGDVCLRFSRVEFMRIMGLCFRDRLGFDPNETYGIPPGGLYDRFYGQGERPLVSQIASDFEGRRFIGVSPEDAVKVAKVLLLYYFLLGSDVTKVGVDNWVWCLVEDEQRWDLFPWGQVSYMTLLHFMDHIVTKVPAKANPDRYRYHFYGCTFALLVWAYERLPAVAAPYGHVPHGRLNLRPLCLRWIFRKWKRVDRTLFDQALDVVDFPMILPDELSQGYWIGIEDEPLEGLIMGMYTKSFSKTSTKAVRAYDPTGNPWDQRYYTGVAVDDAWRGQRADDAAAWMTNRDPHSYQPRCTPSPDHSGYASGERTYVEPGSYDPSAGWHARFMKEHDEQHRYDADAQQPLDDRMNDSPGFHGSGSRDAYRGDQPHQGYDQDFQERVFRRLDQQDEFLHNLACQVVSEHQTAHYFRQALTAEIRRLRSELAQTRISEAGPTSSRSGVRHSPTRPVEALSPMAPTPRGDEEGIMRSKRQRNPSAALQSPFTTTDRERRWELYRRFISSREQIDVGLSFRVGASFFTEMENPSVWFGSEHLDAYLRLLSERPSDIGVHVHPEVGPYCIMDMEFSVRVQAVWNEHTGQFRDDRSTYANITNELLTDLRQYARGSLPVWRGSRSWIDCDMLLFIVHTSGHYYPCVVLTKQMKFICFDSFRHRWDEEPDMKERRILETLPYRRVIPSLMRELDSSGVPHTFPLSPAPREYCFKQEDGSSCGPACLRTIEGLLVRNFNWDTPDHILRFRKHVAFTIFQCARIG